MTRAEVPESRAAEIRLTLDAAVMRSAAPTLVPYLPDREQVPRQVGTAAELQTRTDRAVLALNAAGFGAVAQETLSRTRRARRYRDGGVTWCRTVMAAERAVEELTGQPAEN